MHLLVMCPANHEGQVPLLSRFSDERTSIAVRVRNILDVKRLKRKVKGVQWPLYFRYDFDEKKSEMQCPRKAVKCLLEMVSKDTVVQKKKN